MSNLPKTFALWRLQAELIGGELMDRKRRHLAKRLFKIIDELDAIWLNEFGREYLMELAELNALNDHIEQAIRSAQQCTNKTGGKQ